MVRLVDEKIQRKKRQEKRSLDRCFDFNNVKNSPSFEFYILISSS